MKTAKCKKHGVFTEEEAYLCKDSRYKNGIRLRCKKCDFDQTVKRIKKSSSTHCHLHGELNEENSYTSNEAGRIRKRCKICKKDERAKAYQANRQESKVKAAVWKKENRERVNESVRQDYKLNPEKYRKWQSDFYQRNREAMNTKAICKSHNFDVQDYEEMFKAQNSRCAICEKHETRTFKGKTMRLCLDHDHETGKIRALLCHDCNTGLGKFRDNIDLLTRAAIYLMDNK